MLEGDSVVGGSYVRIVEKGCDDEGKVDDGEAIETQHYKEYE